MTARGFELCFDGDDWNSETVQFWTHGHVTSPTLEDCRDLMRAIACEIGMGGLAAQVRTAKWSTGYTGRVAGVYDLVACEENGETSRYGDEGGPLVATDVEPVTWVTVKR